MARGFADALGLFLLPFVVYGIVVLLQSRFRLLGLAAPRRSGAYVPAHVENGQLVHGEIR